MAIIAFAASSSTTSINKKLVEYAASLLDNQDFEVLDLNDFELPIFSVDLEAKIGQPEAAQAFLNKIQSSSGILISFAEHNGSYSAAYKNLFDWCSRIEPKVYNEKPMVLLATSPGPGGAKSVLSQAVNSMPFFGGRVKASYSLPDFNNNFDLQKGAASNPDIVQEITHAVASLMDEE